jgi:hypothetical protein
LFSHLLVAGVTGTVPHGLVRLDVAYMGMQAEENRLENKAGQLT